MSGRHTPGPWHVVGCSLDAEHRVSYLIRANGMDASKANARLIAAAPELLAMLRGVTDDLDRCLSARGFRDDPKVAGARALIAKAEGN